VRDGLWQGEAHTSPLVPRSDLRFDADLMDHLPSEGPLTEDEHVQRGSR
jgi:hypothetical protein